MYTQNEALGSRATTLRTPEATASHPPPPPPPPPQPAPTARGGHVAHSSPSCGKSGKSFCWSCSSDVLSPDPDGFFTPSYRCAVCTLRPSG